MVQKKRTKKRTKKNTNYKKNTKRRPMKLSITEKRYKQLLRKNPKRLTPRQQKQVRDSLYVKYCKCLKKFKGDQKGYPICMNSIYTRRNHKPPKNASKRCRITFNKNVDR